MNNMTPREKANELYSKYDDLLNKDFGNPIVFDNQLKQCALIAVDELIYETHFEVPNIRQRWWQEVKKEIENL
jgi:hypothetical protein